MTPGIRLRPVHFHVAPCSPAAVHCAAWQDRPCCTVLSSAQDYLKTIVQGQPMDDEFDPMGAFKNMWVPSKCTALGQHPCPRILSGYLANAQRWASTPPPGSSLGTLQMHSGGPTTLGPTTLPQATTSPVPPGSSGTLSRIYIHKRTCRNKGLNLFALQLPALMVASPDTHLQ